jgi:hypothetical protein
MVRLSIVAVIALGGTEGERAFEASGEIGDGGEHHLIQPTRPAPSGNTAGERAPIPPSRKAPGAKKRGVRPSHAERAVLDPYLHAHPELARDLEKDPLLVRDAEYLEKHPELAQFLERYPKMGERIKQDPHSFMRPKKTADPKP